jgi:hypothetical protein
VDGDRREAQDVGASELLALVGRVVFLSVPQRGTNIADWVAGYRLGRRLLIEQLRLSVGTADLPAVGLLQDWATASAAWLAGSDALLAVQDALREADADVGDAGASAVADALESAAALALWLRYMATDFAVIDDLSVRPPGGPSSPAHASEAERARELASWKANRIAVRSYASLSRPPIQTPSGNLDPWDPLKPWTYSRCAPDAPADALYYASYRACAGGPFAVPPDASPVRFRYLRPQHRDALRSWGVGPRLHAWENDGIVNTASMAWPGAGANLLVPADHMDIVGHYRRVAAVGPSRRRFHTYDLLASASGFGDEVFRDVWEDVFEFCCE